MFPEFHPAASDVDVWEVESVFLHVTVVPTATSSWSGEKAPLPKNSAPMGMVTADDGPPGVGAGVGAEGGAE
jgi:hypothetical protein